MTPKRFTSLRPTIPSLAFWYSLSCRGSAAWAQLHRGKHVNKNQIHRSWFKQNQVNVGTMCTQSVRINISINFPCIDPILVLSTTLRCKCMQVCKCMWLVYGGHVRQTVPNPCNIIKHHKTRSAVRGWDFSHLAIWNSLVARSSRRLGWVLHHILSKRRYSKDLNQTMQTGTKRIITNQNGTKANAVTVVHEVSHIFYMIFSYIRKPGDPEEQEKYGKVSSKVRKRCCRMLPDAAGCCRASIKSIHFCSWWRELCVLLASNTFQSSGLSVGQYLR